MFYGFHTWGWYRALVAAHAASSLSDVLWRIAISYGAEGRHAACAVLPALVKLPVRHAACSPCVLPVRAPCARSLHAITRHALPDSEWARLYEIALDYAVGSVTFVTPLPRPFSSR
ncbi:unnamed protein product [Chrysodeixis includens]|uniref:Uncharacterized protein n=1 Tax=Chrysodeixis includens TaxID=689277 RepID=A0A9N8L498_CHRIL|nr:unnamed protein product [Chrysodeixis includens]